MSKTKDNILAVIGRTSDKTGAARERKKSKATPTAYNAVWNDAVAEHFNDVSSLVQPTMKSLAILKRAMGRLPIKAGSSTGRDFIEWVIPNWERVTAQIAKGFKLKIPSTPNVDFFVFRIDRYWEAYCRKGEHEVSSTSSEKTIKLLEAQVAKLTRQVEVLTGELAAAKNEAKAEKAKTNRRRLSKSRSGELLPWD